MSITLSLPDDMTLSVQHLAQRSGRTVEKVLIEALRAHFPAISYELKAEFEALDRASDEDFLLVERMLEKNENGAR